MKRTFFSLLCMIAVPALLAQETPRPSAERALHHIRVLAHDSLGGRAAGTIFADRAADYIEQQFRVIGLQPVGDPPSYRQRMSFVSGVTAGPGNSASFSGPGFSSPLVHDEDFRAMTMSASGSFSGGVVFAGYGIVSPDASYDDYEGIDATGKAVLLLAGYPDSDNPHSLFAEHASAYLKVQKAKEHGAQAVIFVRTEADAPEDSLFALTVQRDQPRSTLVVIHLKRAWADRLLSESRTTIGTLADDIASSKKPASLVLSNVSATITADVVEVHAESDNVVGYLPGADPSLTGEYLIIGAHYDHLGMGGRGSGSLSPDAQDIHNGADDNASGAGALIELAQTFATSASSLKRGILFLAFTAEELGLIGSSHYVAHPVLPIDGAVAMLNMDMVGRMKNRRLIVFGMGTAEGFPDLVQSRNADSLTLVLNSDGFGPSDHSSFYAKKMPVMHFFTDLHTQYHRPTDDVEYIIADTVQPVLDMVQRVALALIDAESRPVYAVAQQERPKGQMRGFRVWVGTIPDYAAQTDGMRISGVSPGSPAEKAGLQEGDVLIKFGPVEIKNIYDYTYALGQFKPGDEVEVTVRRGETTETVHLTLASRNR